MLNIHNLYKYLYYSGDVDYNDETKQIQLTLRRPVFFKVPTSREDSYNPKRRIKAPKSTLELDWVYGYR